MAQVRLTASIHCVVVALVNSAHSRPQSQWLSTSGMVAKRSAAAIVSGRGWQAAYSWYSVLNHRNWIPVVA